MTSAKAAIFAVSLLAVWLTGVATEMEYYGDLDVDENGDFYYPYYGDGDGDTDYDYSYGSFDEIDNDNDAEAVVFNGTPAAESFAYTVAVGSWGRTFCGGWLYDEYTVITAAQCVLNRAFGLHVTVDRYDLRSKTEGQVINVEKLVIHPSYDGVSRENDIAILKLKKPAKIDVPYAKPIGEVSRSQLNADTELIVLGWGSTNENLEIPADLRQGTVGYVDSKTCDDEYYGSMGRVTDQMVCARSVSRQEACAGDSGGPLVLPNKFGADQIVGIVSWGEGCNVVGAPTVYTALTEDIKGWLIDVLRSL